MKKLFFCGIFLFLSTTILYAKDSSISKIQQNLTNIFSKYEQILENKNTGKDEYSFYKNKNLLEKAVKETQPLITELKNTKENLSNTEKDKNNYLISKFNDFNDKLTIYKDNENKIKNIDKFLKEAINFLESCDSREYTSGFSKIISRLKDAQKNTNLNNFQKFKIFEKTDNMIVDVYPYHDCLVGLTITGKIIVIKDYANECPDFSSWTDIKQVCAFYDYILGVKKDNTVIKLCDGDYETCKTDNWNNVKILKTCEHTIGIKKDGTVVACGNNEFGQCNVSDWKNIKRGYVGALHTIALKEDGTVVACGNNEFGQCNVSDWKNIKRISAGAFHTVGLKEDGTVVACGSNEFGQCNVSDWKGIEHVLARSNTTLGLKKDGTVVACGNNELGQCNVSDWKDIMYVKGDLDGFTGIKKDGTLLSTNRDPEKQKELKLLRQYDLSVIQYN